MTQTRTPTHSRKLSRDDLARAPSSIRLIRPGRLARLLDADPSTIWRWRKSGILPEPKRIGGIFGWTEDQIKQLLENGARSTR